MGGGEAESIEGARGVGFGYIWCIGVFECFLVN